MTKSCKINVGGTYKNAKPKINVGGDWKDVKKGWVNVGGTWKVFYEGNSFVTAAVSFDATTFKTDPTGCLTYGGDLTGKRPVLNQSTSLAKATDEGDWAFDTTTGENMYGMYYCTFDSSGKRHQKLDPYNLANYIATWDDTDKKWVDATGSSSITTENTMLMIPTLYWKGDSSGFSISSDSSKGTAYAHTIGGKTYKWLAVGVYLGYNNSSKLMSLSGKAATYNKTRANYRTWARANTVDGGQAGLWNYHQWQLLRFLAYLSCKSFQCQGKIGNGGNAGNTGLCNALGPYAGNVSGTSNAVKCLIEDFWGNLYQYIDDCKFESSSFKADQRAYASVDDSPTTVIYTTTEVPKKENFADTITTEDTYWGMMKTNSGDKSKGLCDYQYQYYSSSYDPVVGGDSSDVLYGYAGPGCLVCDSSMMDDFGSRLSFVLD